MSAINFELLRELSSAPAEAYGRHHRAQDEFYVYAHRRQADGALFYIGKGSGRRAWDSGSRNTHWRNIVSKGGGFVAAIVRTTPDESSAFALERTLIAECRRAGIALANKTDGGDGPRGYRHTQATKDALRARFVGRALSHETRRKMSETRSGMPLSQRHREALRGRVLSQSTRDKIRAGGAPHTARRVAASVERCKRSIVCVDNGSVFASIADAVRWLTGAGFGKARNSALVECCQGLRQSAYGMRWRYQETRL